MRWHACEGSKSRVSFETGKRRGKVRGRGRDSREFSIERALLQVHGGMVGGFQPLDSRSIKSINTARALEEEEEACPCFLYWEQLLFNPSSSERERFLL